MNRRDQQLAEIVGRTSHLDQALLASFYDEVREAYSHSSILDRVATVRETEDRTPSDFRIHSNQELRRIEHFNDRSYFWDTYCRELGRSVALGEEGYLFGVLQEQVPDVEIQDGLGFEGLERSVADLVADGHIPEVILAPIAYMRSLLGQLPSNLVEWDGDGHTYLRSGNRRLELFWSSNGRPLNRFILFERSALIWHVKLDPLSNSRLTVAIGEQVQPVPGVLWLAESTTKIEIANIRGFRSFRPDVAPDDDFEEVR